MKKMSKPIVAIIGKPNVGKSTFFNYIVGKRISIVEDTPGVTRDRVYAETNWRGRNFTVVDTAGIEPESNDIIISQMREQAEIAIEIADVIIFLTDVKQGVTAADQEIALMLQKSKKPIILVCNKVDNFQKYQNDIYEFYNLGIGDPLPISATNAQGIGDVLDSIYDNLPKKLDGEHEEERIRVAVIGKPNVGKSSLINKILGENRNIVSDIAGTTRDAIDSPFENEKGKYIFIDTAGIRRKSKVTESIEKFSVMRSLLAVERADVVLMMIDSMEGVTDQDAKIAGEAHEAGKGVIIVVNKWDEYEKETGTMERYKKEIYNKLSYLSYAPIIFISAKTGQRVDKLFDVINNVAEQNAKRISTSMLNQVINEAIAIVQPPTDKGKRLKIYYGTQVATKPPTFVIFVNRKELFHFSYERYLVNQIRKEFGLEGTPVRIIAREKLDKDMEKI
jgi:GTP-binding protein